jgi:hypothetical protein
MIGKLKRLITAFLLRLAPCFSGHADGGALAFVAFGGGVYSLDASKLANQLRMTQAIRCDHAYRVEHRRAC